MKKKIAIPGYYMGKILQAFEQVKLNNYSTPENMKPPIEPTFDDSVKNGKVYKLGKFK